MVWGKIYSNTVTADDQSFDTGTVSTSKLIDILFSQNGHTGNSLMRFNGDTGTNYAETFAVNSATDSSRQGGTSNINVLTAGTGDVQTLTVMNMVNISGEEKLSVYDTIYTNATGTGTAPLRVRGVSKWANTEQITQTTVTDSGNGFDTGSNLTVLGSEITPASAIPFPINVELGSRAEITDTRKIYYRMDGDYESTKWYELGTVPYAGGRAVFGGGLNTGSSAVDTIDYITIATLGNADTFGDLSQARYGLGAMANKTRTLFAGGNTGGGNQTTIDFVTPATLGDATTFGNISNDTSKTYGVMCLSSETRGIIAGGESGYSNRIDYVTIDTEGNSTTFGATLTVAGKQGATTSDGTRGVFMGGEGRTPTMDYITIASTGTCTDFGDLRETLYGGSHGLATDGTIGIFTTGNSYSSNVEKITIQTLGNSTNFGNMDTGRSNLGLASDKTRAIFAGGKTASGSNYTNTIEYIDIAIPAICEDFGDLQVARQVLAGASDTGADRS